MSNSFSRFFLYIFYVLACSNCRQKNNVYDPKAIELNNKAVQCIKVQKFDSALMYLDEAVKIDSTDYMVYQNKSIVYSSLKDFKTALLMTEKEIGERPDVAEGWVFAGMLNDQLGDSLRALKYYKRSIELFDERISNPAMQKYLKINLLNKAVSYLLIGQEDTACNEIKKLKQLYPSDTFLNDYLIIDKQEYLRQIFK